MGTPDIVFTRVDNRLIHGQVGNVWLGSTSANLIVVVDDDTAANPVLQSVMKMTANARGVGVRFFSVEKAIATLPKASAAQHLFLVAKTPAVVRRLVESGLPITQCNIGNMHFEEGKTIYKESHVYVDDNDLADIEYLKNRGLDVYIQILPTEKRIAL